MERRDFLKTTALLASAFAGGFYMGNGPELRRSSGTALMAFLPDGKEWDLRIQDLMKEPTFLACTIRSQALATPLPGDLALLGDGCILDPRESFGSSLLRLREDLRGTRATRLLQLENPQDDRRLPAKELRISGPFAEQRFSLDKAQEISLDAHLSGSRLRIDALGVRMVQAACRHEHCCRMGTIRLVGQRLACAPAGILIEMV
jgi:hypothetical protein